MLAEPEIKDYLVFNKSDILEDVVGYHFGGKDPREIYEISPLEYFRFGLDQSDSFEMVEHNVGEYIRWYPANKD